MFPRDYIFNLQTHSGVSPVVKGLSTRVFVGSTWNRSEFNACQGCLKILRHHLDIIEIDRSIKRCNERERERMKEIKTIGQYNVRLQLLLLFVLLKAICISHHKTHFDKMLSCRIFCFDFWIYKRTIYSYSYSYSYSLQLQFTVYEHEHIYEHEVVVKTRLNSVKYSKRVFSQI